jgi:hypothetical protein
MMILFSLTVNIDNEIQEEWLEWMKQSFIPNLWLTGFFVEKRFLKLLNEEEGNGTTYSLQLTLENLKVLRDFEENHLHDFRKMLYGKYTGRLVDFYTVLEKVEL